MHLMTLNESQSKQHGIQASVRAIFENVFMIMLYASTKVKDASMRKRMLSLKYHWLCFDNKDAYEIMPVLDYILNKKRELL